MSDDWGDWKKNAGPQSGRRTAPIDQVGVEAEINRLSQLLEEETEVFEQLAKDAAETEAAYKKAWWADFLHAEGPQKQRESMAGYKNAQLHEDALVADALKTAKRERLHSLRTQLDALRTIAANVREQTR